MRNAAERVLPVGLIAAVALSGAVLLGGCANVSVLSVSHAGDADGVSATSIRVGTLEKTIQEKDKLLDQKRVLAEELQHRVRNNLQLVYSMLSQQFLWTN